MTKLSYKWQVDGSEHVNLNTVPADGSPHLGQGNERRLRGGCHHNWNLHCTVSWRYGITPDAHDGCIGLRVVLSARSW